jgi:hypothetical protein
MTVYLLSAGRSYRAGIVFLKRDESKKQSFPIQDEPEGGGLFPIQDEPEG